jgi:hypothetical protein
LTGEAEGGADRLLQFAGEFIGGISHHKDLRTEILAEAFRAEFGLTQFPLYEELVHTCNAVGIHVSSLPPVAPMEGVNVWADGQSPLIKIREAMARARAETTICHELREVLENAFKRVKPSYLGLNTHDNRAMNPESDQFAGYLLMQSEAARAGLSINGFDVASFAAAAGRSLPSVVLRAQTLFPASWSQPAPVAGLWLYEAPWESVISGRVTATDLQLSQVARLNGFSTDKKKNAVGAFVFPKQDGRGDDAEIVGEAVAKRLPVARALQGFDMFGDRDFLLVAEPSFVRGGLWRVLVTAVRNDCLPLVEPWLHRLEIQSASVTYQKV